MIHQVRQHPLVFMASFLLGLALSLTLLSPASMPDAVSSAPVELETEEVHHAGGGFSSGWMNHEWEDSRPIRRGDTGPRVFVVQALLNRMGWHVYSQSSCSRTYSVRVNGTWNGCDDWAMDRFQYRHGLSRTGEVFWADYNALQKTSRHLHWSSGGADVCRGLLSEVVEYTQCEWYDGYHSPRDYTQHMYWSRTYHRWAWYHVTDGRWYWG